jgi:membrane protease YdiL (CAAX protease family)
MENETASTRSIVGIAIACEGALGLIALAVGWFVERRPLEQIAWSLPAIVQGLAAAVPMFAALWLVTRWPIGPLRALKQLVRDLVVPLFRGCTPLDLVLISAAAGIGEELLFRGVVQAGIHSYTHSAWLAIAVAGVLFGLAHPISTTYAILAALIGVYLGWLLVATDNLLVPIITHAAYDFLALVYLLHRGSSPGSAEHVVEGAELDGTGEI